MTGGGVPVIANAGGDAADPDETFTVTGGTGGTGSTNSTHFNGGTDGPRGVGFRLEVCCRAGRAFLVCPPVDQGSSWSGGSGRAVRWWLRRSGRA